MNRQALANMINRVEERILQVQRWSTGFALLGLAIAVAEVRASTPNRPSRIALLFDRCRVLFDRCRLWAALCCPARRTK